jgi:glucosamine--fructose-6-phosphate aminotransferase (isomerizing)
MCGIVGGKVKGNVVPILVRGLHRLEYRGYDSAGVAVVSANPGLTCVRNEGKVSELEKALHKRVSPLSGHVGIAHTRWGTHGKASDERNAHPHVSNAEIAVVHNGIIENYEDLREKLVAKGYVFLSETDSEVIPHSIHSHLREHHDLLRAVQETVAELRGAYAIAVVSASNPERIIAVRFGSPLVVGIGDGDREGEFFVASDALSLRPFTENFKYLEDGDVVDMNDRVSIYDREGQPANRPTQKSEIDASSVDRGDYRHYMQKEIFEQPDALRATLEGRMDNGLIREGIFGEKARGVFDAISSVHIIACGTSFHSGMVASYWFESLAGISCRAEVASEFRYRNPVLRKDTLYVFISQSGETADTLACEREVKRRLPGAHTLAICNVPESSLVRESKLTFMTRAGAEIGVASTKAFTTQMAAFGLLVLALGERKGMEKEALFRLASELQGVSNKVEEVLSLDPVIRNLAGELASKQHAIFLGRGAQYPIALEGALKLKEITYIDANGYPSGELKHGTLALVDGDLPIIALLPNDALLEKNLSNLKEVRARGGKPIIFAGKDVKITEEEGDIIVRLPEIESVFAPILYTVPLQLLAYHTAVLRGTNVDQPRNLAKSVTVE